MTFSLEDGLAPPGSAAVLFYGPGRLRALPPLTLYAHFPWCARKCPYCDFNSREMRGDLDEGAYAAALLDDLAVELPFVWGRRVCAGFFGGGTPGLMSGATVDKLLSGFRSLLRWDSGAEFTLEANPGALDESRFAAFAQAGVNRISLGVQSFDDASLRALGRIHDSLRARRAIDEALLWFGRVNVDLMYGLPGQTMEMALKDARIAASLGLGHLSFYQLTLEPNTAFGLNPPQGMPHPDAIADAESALRDVLADSGYGRYEISAYARSPSDRCRHNLNYWSFGDYIGIGPGAHGKISSASGIERTVRPKGPREWARAVEAAKTGAPEAVAALRGARPIAGRDMAGEYMMNALRLKDGFLKTDFESRTGMSFSSIAQPVRRGEALGLLFDDGARVGATEKGYDFLNDAIELFFPG